MASIKIEASDVEPGAVIVSFIDGEKQTHCTLKGAQVEQFAVGMARAMSTAFFDQTAALIAEAMPVIPDERLMLTPEGDDTDE